MARERQLAPVDVKTGVCAECGLVVTQGFCFDCGMWVCEYCWASHGAADADDYLADDEEDLSEWPDDMGHSMEGGGDGQ